MKNFFKQLKNELDSHTPPMSNQLQQTKIVVEDKPKQTSKPTIFTWQRVMAFCVAFVLVVGLGVVGLDGASYQENASYVTLSINPSFSLMLDSNDCVVKVVATNYDGEVVLSDELSAQLIGKSADQVASSLVEQAVELGYVGDGVVTVTAVSAKGDSRAEKILNSISQTTNQTLQNLGMPFVVETVKQTVDELKQTVSQYFGDQSKNGVSGLINAMAQAPSYLEQLSNIPPEDFDKQLEDYNLKNKLNAIRKYLQDLQAKNAVLQQVNWDRLGQLYQSVAFALMLENTKVDPVKLAFDRNQHPNLSAEVTADLDEMAMLLQPVVDVGVKFESYTELLFAKETYQRVDEMVAKLNEIDGYILEGSEFVKDLIQACIDEVCAWIEGIVDDAEAFAGEVNSCISANNPQEFANSIKDKISAERTDRKNQHGNGGHNPGGGASNEGAEPNGNNPPNGGKK